MGSSCEWSACHFQELNYEQLNVLGAAEETRKSIRLPWDSVFGLDFFRCLAGRFLRSDVI